MATLTLPLSFVAARVRLAGVSVDGPASASPVVSVGAGSVLSGFLLRLSGVTNGEELGRGRRPRKGKDMCLTSVGLKERFPVP